MTNQQPIVIGMGLLAGRSRTVFALIFCAVGAGSIGSTALDAVHGNEVTTGRRIAEIVFGLLVLAGGGLLWRHRRMLIPKQVVLEPGGIRWEDTAGTFYAVAWDELASVSIATARKLVGYRRQGPGVLVRIDLVPSDGSFRDRHPELAPYRTAETEERYRVPLGEVEPEIDRLQEGLHRYAQTRFRGTTDDGFSLNVFRDT